MQSTLLQPADRLAAVVKTYATLEGTLAGTPAVNRIVPDGSAKLVFHYGAPYERLGAGGRRERLPGAFVVGSTARPLDVAPGGATGSFVTVFDAVGLATLPDLCADDLAGGITPLSEAFGAAGAQLAACVFAAADAAERAALVDEFLAERAVPVPPDQADARSLTAFVQAHAGQVTVAELCAYAKLSPRRLLRLFRRAVGLSPKRYARIVRLQAALLTLRDRSAAPSPAPRLTDIAYGAGYADQAHFTREFRALTGLPPKRHADERLRMTLAYEPRA